MTALSRRGAGVQGGGIRQKLRRSHLNVAMIGLGMVVIALAATAWLRASALRLATERGPIVAASMQALSGAQRSGAELSGWVAFGGEEFKHRRAAAWEHEIKPALRSLMAVRQLSNDLPAERLDQLGVMLKRLEGLQGEIETVAQTPANEPAKALLMQTAEPAGSAIEAAVENLLKEVAAAGATGSLTAAVGLGALHAALESCQALLRGYVEAGDAADEAGLHRHLASAIERADDLATHTEWFAADQRDRLVGVRRDLTAYGALIDQVITLRKEPGWNVAQHLMTSGQIPLLRQVTGFLHGISAGQIALMGADATLVNQISYLGIGLLLVPIIAMAIAVVVVSQRGAEEMTRPITALVKATQALGAGRLAEDIPVIGHDEIALLTRTFNEMRAALAERTRQVEQTTASIRETGTHLASATARILAATHQLALGAEVQAGDVARVEASANEVADLGEQAVQRARALAQSAQWAEAIGKVGHKTVDASVYAMSRLREEVDAATGLLKTLAQQAGHMGETIDTMSVLAEQTHVLACNASAEGARSGETGRALSFVSDEIEALADQSKTAAYQVRATLEEAQRTMQGVAQTTQTAATVVTASVRVVNRASDTIKTLVDVATQANQYAGESLTSAGQQAADMAQVHQSIVQIAEVTQANVTSMKAVEQVAQDLSALGDRLKTLLAGYDGIA